MSDIQGEFDLSEVKRAFLELTQGQNPFQSNRARAQELYRNWTNDVSGHYGATIPEMRTWIRDGYPLSIPAIRSAMMAKTNKRKFIRAEEGELILEAVYSGEDYPFLNQTKIPARPGLLIEAEYSTLAQTSASAIAAYGRFVGELCALYQSKGFDLGLSVIMTGVKRFRDQSNQLTKSKIVLKREGIIADPIEWSPAFSPGGYRMLGFVSHMLLGDTLRKVCRRSMGSTQQSKAFGATFERSKRTLTIQAPNSYSTFPAAELRDAIERLGI